MERTRISSGTPFEIKVGYSRAVRVGETVFVSGTTAMKDGQLVGVGDCGAQTRQTLENIVWALEQAGATANDVVRYRIYLTNILEYDPINSFHLHGNFFDYYPTGTRLESSEFTDTISQVQGQRGILELRFPYTGKYMFHAHKTEFAELGWMGFFEVVQ